MISSKTVEKKDENLSPREPENQGSNECNHIALTEMVKTDETPDTLAANSYCIVSEINVVPPQEPTIGSVAPSVANDDTGTPIEPTWSPTNHLGSLIAENPLSAAVQSCTPPSTVVDPVMEPTPSTSSARRSSNKNSIAYHFQVLKNTRDANPPTDPVAKQAQKRSAQSMCEPWDCHQCTFRNHMRLRYTMCCEMCLTPRIVPDVERVQD
jgi:hypothetical protein